MKNATLNNELTLSYPDDFEAMDAETLGKISQGKDTEGWGVWDPGHHVVITVLREHKNSLLLKLADPRAAAKQNEKATRKLYAGHGYEFGTFFTKTIAEREAAGYTYTFDDNDSVRSVKVLLVKHSGSSYGILCSCPQDELDAMGPVFDQVFDSIALA